MVNEYRGFDSKARDAADRTRAYTTGMIQGIDRQEALGAFERRDRGYDGRFVVAVTTTGIYCKPSCPARRPRPEHLRLFADATAAREAGFRPCLRCLPDSVGRDRKAIGEAAALLERGDDWTLEALAAEVEYAAHHFHRLFKRATGVTPAAYARAVKAKRAGEALTKEKTVTDAVYAAGYKVPSRFYDGAKRLGMTPSAWARGGEGVTIRWTVVPTSLGALMIAATDKGLCRVAFDEDEAVLHRRFPRAEIVAGGDALAALAARVVAQVESPGRDHGLPLDVQGTAFQEAVWRALQAIPPGATRSYAELATDAGNPRATRAAGGACGANPVAVVIPCHRVTRSDGDPGGYAWGPERKRTLLNRERG